MTELRRQQHGGVEMTDSPIVHKLVRLEPDRQSHYLQMIGKLMEQPDTGFFLGGTQGEDGSDSLIFLLRMQSRPRLPLSESNRSDPGKGALHFAVGGASQGIPDSGKFDSRDTETLSALLLSYLIDALYLALDQTPITYPNQIPHSSTTRS